MSAPDLVEEYARHQETWSRWLEALSQFAAETNRNRARLVASHVEETMPEAIRARLAMVELMPVEMRRRELEAPMWAARLADMVAPSLDSIIPVRIEQPADDERGGKT